jgi:DNA polymerase III gamma/tau subunit
MAQEIWLEKYRPKVLDEVFGNKEIIDSLKTCVAYG